MLVLEIQSKSTQTLIRSLEHQLIGTGKEFVTLYRVPFYMKSI